MIRRTFGAHATGWVRGPSSPLRGHVGYGHGRTSLLIPYSMPGSMGRSRGPAECGPLALSQPPSCT
eukprot:15467154-Alexandrium_andersonii.AAC.1